MEDNDNAQVFGLRIADPDAHRADAIFGANGSRIIRTFDIGGATYLDARDCGALRMEVVWMLRWREFWGAIGVYALCRWTDMDTMEAIANGN